MWAQFERICANDLQLLPVETLSFHQAAMVTMDAAAGLRAGDALHLACAMKAKRFKLKPVAIWRSIRPGCLAALRFYPYQACLNSIVSLLQAQMTGCSGEH